MRCFWSTGGILSESHDLPFPRGLEYDELRPPPPPPGRRLPSPSRKPWVSQAGEDLREESSRVCVGPGEGGGTRGSGASYLTHQGPYGLY